VAEAERDENKRVSSVTDLILVLNGDETRDVYLLPKSAPMVATAALGLVFY